METVMRTTSFDTVLSNLSSELEQSVEIYDVAASCYNVLLSIKNDDDRLFLMRASTLSDDWQYKENAEYLYNFRRKIIQYTSNIESQTYTLGSGLDKFIHDLIWALREMHCPSGMEEEDFIAFCMYYCLEAIDLYVKSVIKQNISTLRNYGPLNYDVNKESCLVYLQEQSSILKEAYGEDEPKFRIPLRNDRIGSVFSTLLMIKRSSLCDRAGVPKIVHIDVSEECKNEILKTKHLKIANIPFIGFDTFNMYDTNSEYIHDTSEFPKGPFRVMYADDPKNIEMVLSLLCSAIEGGANIIVFPEFVMSSKMLKEVKNKLEKIKESEKKRLIAVFAGTTIEIGENHKANNVLHILNSSGTDVGTYYKHSQYVHLFEETTHSVLVKHNKNNPYAENRGNNEGQIYFSNCEILSEPGKICTIVEADPVGRILPAICRDVTDGKYTSGLVDLFMPTLLLAPSWSTSISSFEIRFSQYAESIHTSSLMCNCCNAIADKKQESTIGVFAYPVKEYSAMRTAMLKMKRHPTCRPTCESKGGCVRYITINFADSGIKCYEEVTYPKINKSANGHIHE